MAFRLIQRLSQFVSGLRQRPAQGLHTGRRVEHAGEVVRLVRRRHLRLVVNNTKAVRHG